MPLILYDLHLTPRQAVEVADHLVNRRLQPCCVGISAIGLKCRHLVNNLRYFWPITLGHIRYRDSLHNESYPPTRTHAGVQSYVTLVPGYDRAVQYSAKILQMLPCTDRYECILNALARLVTHPLIRRSQLEQV